MEAAKLLMLLLGAALSIATILGPTVGAVEVAMSSKSGPLRKAVVTALLVASQIALLKALAGIVQGVRF